MNCKDHKDLMKENAQLFCVTIFNYTTVPTRNNSETHVFLLFLSYRVFFLFKIEKLYA